MINFKISIEQDNKYVHLWMTTCLFDLCAGPDILLVNICVRLNAINKCFGVAFISDNKTLPPVFPQNVQILKKFQWFMHIASHITFLYLSLGPLVIRSRLWFIFSNSFTVISFRDFPSVQYNILNFWMSIVVNYYTHSGHKVGY